MMRNLDKIVLFGSVALLALALLLEVRSVARLNGAVSGAADEARRLSERVNKNNLKAREMDPAEYSGKVFAAWETPAIDAQPFGSRDFYPDGTAAR